MFQNNIINITLATLLFFILSFFIFSSTTVHYLSKPGPLKESKTIIIEKGYSIDKIANLLYDKNVIKYPFLFKLVAKITGIGSDFKAGEYQFNKQVSIANIFDILISGKVVIHKLTIPEGLTTKQIIEIINKQDLLVGIVSNSYKEGYLLPDTYHYVYGDRKQSILDRMYKKNLYRTQQIWDKRKIDSPIDSLEKAIILASIIEKETSNKSEKQRIAAVFINRLNKNMKLQADPTVIYALTEGEGILDRKLTRKDLKIDSPFNTYMYKGLPPTAISNPSIATIEATLNPIETEELYFVVNGEGSHNFSINLREHINNIKKYKKKLKDKASE